MTAARRLLAVPALGICALAAGCGGGSPGVATVAASTATSAATTPSGPTGRGNDTVLNIGNAAQGARFAACIRRHGEPGFPDPNARGEIRFGSSAGVDPRSPAFRSAFGACRSLLASGFGQPPGAAQLARVQQRLLAFSRCMREHGIGDFPDPSGGGLPQIRPQGDLDPHGAPFERAYAACRSHLPPGLPGKALGFVPPGGSS